MKKIVKALEGLPWIIRILLILLWNVYGNLLRLFRSIAKKSILGTILSIILLCTGWIAFPIWILDIIFTVLGRRVWWIC